MSSKTNKIGFSQYVGKESFIPENMVYRLGFKASNETAQKFQALLADEVLPALRKTGTYTIKDNKSSTKEDAQLARAKAMELNAKTRAAQTWLKIADRTKIQEYKEIANSYAANTLAGERVLELPTANRKPIQPQKSATCLECQLTA